jgi:hypothetical protein
MKLDKDLVREVLLAVEADAGDPRAWVEMDIPGHDYLEVAYHIQILDEAGFLEAEDLGSHDGYAWRAKRLTYKGHEFLDTVRDPVVWRKTKELAAKAGSASLPFLWSAAKEIIKQQAQLHGISL